MKRHYPRHPAPLLSLSLLLLLPGAALAADDWPQWRGPNRDGIASGQGLLKEWPAEGPKLLFKATGLGRGYSSVITSGDRVFTMGDRGEDSFLIALNRADGKELWATRVGRSGAPGWGGFAGPRCTPATDGERVYTVSQWGDLICAEARTGAVQWSKDYPKDFGSKRPEWGWSESPLLDGNLVVVTPGGPGGAIVALDKKSGNTVWRSKQFTDDAHYSSLIIAEIGGVKQYVQLTEASVAGVSARDGRLLWSAPRKGKTAVIPTPIYQDGLVYVTSGYGIGCHAFKVTMEDDEFSAEQVYANKTMANHHGGVLLLGGHVYGHSDGKGWTCQDLKTGEAKWQEKGKVGKGSVVAIGRQLILRAEDGKGTVALIEASPEGYVEKGRFEQPDRSDKNSWAHPVVSAGRLWLRDQDVLLCYDLTGK